MGEKREKTEQGIRWQRFIKGVMGIMTEEEVSVVISTILCTYPNWKPNVPMSFLKKTWTTLLSDMDNKTVTNNLVKYIQSDTTGFAPSIGTLRQGATEYPTELEAWAIVRKAIKNSGYNANEEFSKLPDAIKRAVGSPSNLYHWALTDSDTLGTVEQSHFISVYRSVITQLKNKEARHEEFIPIAQTLFDEEPKMIETEKPTVNQAKIEEMIEAIKNGTYRRKTDDDV